MVKVIELHKPKYYQPREYRQYAKNLRGNKSKVARCVRRHTLSGRHTRIEERTEILNAMNGLLDVISGSG